MYHSPVMFSEICPRVAGRSDIPLKIPAFVRGSGRREGIKGVTGDNPDERPLF